MTGSWFFPDRVDLPFVTVRDAAGPISDQRLTPPNFRDRDWSADWFAWLVLGEFIGTAWQGSDPGTWTAQQGFPAAGVDVEINRLVRAAQDERADALGEIISQSDEFISVFMGLMNIRPTSYPQTMRLLQAASLVGAFTVMHWKKQYSRPRPSQLCPALLPPIAVPGHPSYPSGHSTQAHLMALCMGQVFDGLPAPQQAQMAAMRADLGALADRIARNREIAGLHYPSDSAGGVTLAGNLASLLDGLPAASNYAATVSNAVGEWTW